MCCPIPEPSLTALPNPPLLGSRMRLFNPPPPPSPFLGASISHFPPPPVPCCGDDSPFPKQPRQAALPLFFSFSVPLPPPFPAQLPQPHHNPFFFPILPPITNLSPPFPRPTPQPLGPPLMWVPCTSPVGVFVCGRWGAGWSPLPSPLPPLAQILSARVSPPKPTVERPNVFVASYPCCVCPPCPPPPLPPPLSSSNPVPCPHAACRNVFKATSPPFPV